MNEGILQSAIKSLSKEVSPQEIIYLKVLNRFSSCVNNIEYNTKQQHRIYENIISKKQYMDIEYIMELMNKLIYTESTKSLNNMIQYLQLNIRGMK